MRSTREVGPTRADEAIEMRLDEFTILGVLAPGHAIGCRATLGHGSSKVEVTADFAVILRCANGSNDQGNTVGRLHHIDIVFRIVLP
jgi:hypothetical protein